MLGVSEILLAVASVSLLSGPGRGRRVAGVVAAAMCLGAGVQVAGPVGGTVGASVIGMAAASVLALLLPPRPALAVPIGVVSGTLGAVAWLAT